MFVDVDPRTRNIDLAAAAAAITPRTRALMPVYLAGLADAAWTRLYAIARAHGLRVIEDAAQAIDSRWQGRRIGSFGDLVSFSFQANKNITCAEGGCLVLNSAAEAERVERLRLQGVVRAGADGMDVEVPRRQVQPHRHQRDDRPAPAAAPRRDHAPPRRAGGALLRGGRATSVSRRSASSCRSARREPTRRQLAHVPGAAARPSSFRAAEPR